MRCTLHGCGYSSLGLSHENLSLPKSDPPPPRNFRGRKNGPVHSRKIDLPCGRSPPAVDGPPLIHACAPLIDGLGHATWSGTVPVSRARTLSFQKNRHFLFHALVALKRLVACSARIVVGRQTQTQTNYCNPRCACAPRVNDTCTCDYCIHNVYLAIYQCTFYKLTS